MPVGISHPYEFRYRQPLEHIRRNRQLLPRLTIADPHPLLRRHRFRYGLLSHGLTITFCLSPGTIYLFERNLGLSHTVPLHPVNLFERNLSLLHPVKLLPRSWGHLSPSHDPIEMAFRLSLSSPLLGLLHTVNLFTISTLCLDLLLSSPTM
jgi:hypothetical protein